MNFIHAEGSAYLNLCPRKSQSLCHTRFVWSSALRSLKPLPFPQYYFTCMKNDAFQCRGKDGGSVGSFITTSTSRIAENSDRQYVRGKIQFSSRFQSGKTGHDTVIDTLANKTAVCFCHLDMAADEKHVRMSVGSELAFHGAAGC